MKSQENNQKNQDYLALINQEYTLVVDGKNADRLAKLFKDYETDPFTNRIEKVDAAIEKYAHALIINGQYLDLGFLLERYKGQTGITSKANDVLIKIADFGQKESIKQLWEQIRAYIVLVSGRPRVGKRIKQATIDNTVKILAKYFLNFGVDELSKLTGITEQELVERGVEIRDKFIQLKEEKVASDCLQSKLKELAVVASKMSQFE